MKTARQSEELLSRIRPSSVEAYLKAQSWILEDTYNDREMFWVRNVPNHLEVNEILLPLKPEYRDFALRMSEVVDVVSASEQRARVDVIRDFLTAEVDVVKLRVQSDKDDGSIGLQDGINLFNGAKDMLSAAARSTVAPRAQFLSGLPREVSNYLRKVRVGQTERGSYIVKMFSPTLIAEEKSNTDSSQLFDDSLYSDGFGRDVVNVLMDAVKATHDSAEEAQRDPTFAAFRRNVNKGVSANLCQALVDMGSETGNSGIEVNIRWAFTAPEPSRNYSTVKFDAELMPALKEAIYVLKESSPYQNFDVEGYVYKLQRRGPLDTGKVTIVGYVDDQVRQISVELDPDEYDIAVNAHEFGHRVLVTGRLEKRGRGYILQHPKQMKMVGEQTEIGY